MTEIILSDYYSAGFSVKARRPISNGEMPVSLSPTEFTQKWFTTF